MIELKVCCTWTDESEQQSDVGLSENLVRENFLNLKIVPQEMDLKIEHYKTKCLFNM